MPLPDWAQGIITAIDQDTGVDVSDFAAAGVDIFEEATGSAAPPSAMQPVRSFSGGMVATPVGFNIGGPTGITFGPSSPKTPIQVPSTGPGGFGVSFATIRGKMFAKLGFKPRRKTVMYLLRTLGIVIASQVLGIDVADALFLFMHKRHGSRRHYVQTMVKAIRRGDRFRHQLGKYKVPHMRRGSSAPRRRAHRRK